METIRGKKSFDIEFNEFTFRHKNYNRIVLDLGTGDGKFAFHYAQTFSNNFVIGLDSCRENLHEYSRANLSNLLYVIANAQSLPCELYGLISHISINFPWGSLLESLVTGDSNLMHGLMCIAQPNTTIDILLNAGAISEMGICLEAGASQIQEKMREVGWRIKNVSEMKISDLKKFPTTWSKRLAYGRDPRATSLNGCFSP